MAKFSASATIDRFSVGEDGITLFLRGSVSSRINDENEEYILFRSNERDGKHALLLKKDISFKVSQEILEKCFSEANLLVLQQQHIRSKFTIDDPPSKNSQNWSGNSNICESDNSNAYEIVEWTVG